MTSPEEPTWVEVEDPLVDEVLEVPRKFLLTVAQDGDSYKWNSYYWATNASGEADSLEEAKAAAEQSFNQPPTP